MKCARSIAIPGWLLILLIAPTARAAPINLLPLGDSITEMGFYVSPLQTALMNNGYASSVIANEGHAGYVINGGIAGAPGPGLREHVGPGTDPDFLNHPNVNSANTYILLMIGSNDVNVGLQLGTSQVQSRMSGLIAAIRAEAPLAHLIVAKIAPNLDSAAKDLAVQKFNSDIAGVVTGTNVSLVDMYSAFQPNPAQYMGDFIHPNQLGGDRMAEVWFQGIQAVPEPTGIVSVILGWPGCAGIFRRRRMNKGHSGSAESDPRRQRGRWRAGLALDR
jgi:lysophospholipase L1-like esterase